MYRFIDDDPEISREDFSANVLQVLETDGALYQIAPTYYVEFLCAAPSLTEGIISCPWMTQKNHDSESLCYPLRFRS